METELTPVNDWRLIKKFLFRFFAIYFFLYIFPFPLDMIPHSDIVLNWYQKFWEIIVRFTAKAIFHVSYPFENTSDSTYAFVQVFIFLILALLAAVIWTTTDRKRKNYDLLLYWLRVYIRYFLSFTMLIYATGKFFKYQLPSLNPFFLTMSYGQSSPMTLMWNFMGYSYSYNLFTGLAEAAGAFFLLFRRTTLAGGLMLLAVLSNVVMMNFSFDIYVKLESTNLLLMTIFIIAPDFKRLSYFFFLNRSVPALKPVPQFNKKWMRITRNSFKALIILYVIYSKITGGLELKILAGKDSASSLYGAYQVEIFVLNKDTLPPLGTDTLRWSKFLVPWEKNAIVKKMNDSLKRYELEVNEKLHTFILKRRDSTQNVFFAYSRPEPDQLILFGKFRNDSLYIRMKKMEFALEKHKFRLINDDPYK